MILRQHWVNRWGSLIPGGVVAYAFLSQFKPGMPAADITLVALFVAVPAYLVVRSFRAGVVLKEEQIVVRGWLWSRSIPRDRVLELTRLKMIRWTSRSGRRRLTPLAMFWEYPPMTGGMTASNEYALSSIRAWIRGAEPPVLRHRTAQF